MQPFEQLSRDIDYVAQRYKTSRWIRWVCRIDYWRLRWKNEPYRFRWVEEEGAPVGEPIKVLHPTFHDMMEHQAAGALTGKVLLDGLRANAIQWLSFERLDEWRGVTTIQPRWV